jgi:CspA family cold shock protein
VQAEPVRKATHKPVVDHWCFGYYLKNKGEEGMQGTVKMFSNEKGYGFIKPDDGSDDVFIHHSNIVMDGYKTLTEEQRVEFDTQPGRNGKTEAVDVTPL